MCGRNSTDGYVVIDYYNWIRDNAQLGNAGQGPYPLAYTDK